MYKGCSDSKRRSKGKTPMSTIQEELKEIKKRAVEAEAELQAKGKAFVQDKSIPLNERWALFLELDLGDEDPWIVHFKSFEKKFPDDFPISYEHEGRGSLQFIKEWNTHLLENIFPPDWEGGPFPIPEDFEEQKDDPGYFDDIVDEYPYFTMIHSWQDRNGKTKYDKGCILEDIKPRLVQFTLEDYDAWREEVLEMYIKSYRYDW